MTDTNGRITTKQFYEALIDQNKQRQDMEDRIMNRLRSLDYITRQVEDNKKGLAAVNEDLRTLERRYNWWSGLNSMFGIAIGGLLAYLKSLGK